MKQTTSSSLLYSLLSENSCTTGAAQAAIHELERRGVKKVRVLDAESGRYYISACSLPYMGNKSKRLVDDLAPVFRK